LVLVESSARCPRGAGRCVPPACRVENGTLCPLSMTHGSAGAFAQAPDLAARWLPLIYSRDYDPAFAPVTGKRSALVGMGMTEKQGGSDVRANTTVATAAGDGTWRLHGHKWF